MFSPTIDLTSVCGFRQNPDSNGEQLSALTTSDSGLFINDAHPLLTINNLASVAEQEQDFTAWLTQRVQGSILTALNRWCLERVQFNNARRVMNAGVLPEISNERKVITSNNWVGLFYQGVGKGRSFKVHKLGLHFASTQSVDIKVFRQDSKDPVKEQTLNYTDAGSVQWIDFELSMDKPMNYYIVYDATGKDPYDSVYTYKSPCQITGCDTGSDIGGELWDLDDTQYSYSSNYGLFLDYTYGCDLTDFIVQNKLSFARLLQLQIASDLLRELAMNSNARVNRNEANIDTTTILYEIDGDSQGRPGGIKRELERTLKSLSLDMSGIDKRCLGCRKGIKYGAV